MREKKNCNETGKVKDKREYVFENLATKVI